MNVRIMHATYPHTYTHTHTHARTHARTHTRTHAHTHTHTHPLSLSLALSLSLPPCMHMHLLRTCVFLSTYIPTLNSHVNTVYTSVSSSVYIHASSMHPPNRTPSQPASQPAIHPMHPVVTVMYQDIGSWAGTRRQYLRRHAVPRTVKTMRSEEIRARKRERHA